jgi:hypothetical protein
MRNDASHRASWNLGGSPSCVTLPSPNEDSAARCNLFLASPAQDR